ncbi:copine-9-like protein [Basidiobolus meristosporus CBS 931.73]|uniref:Copine-9-like protein n=1 Tax=Basidiobolus meristosporus CBS 931.73 TaxID=1314790 RepID=A0A1Y1Y5N5_9FUNG|nr:copine-9-like protein [Basidiobolus meristosporus CBS 931.73]|eukprot:ORX93327.1 copine-9-like protein [Basidiobolus meristosporus CBS 931.73]
MSENPEFNIIANLETPESCLELRISCKNLAKMDICFPSDPLVVCQVFKEGVWQEFGRTEFIKNDSNPNFTTSFKLEYRFSDALPLKFHVYDIDDPTHSIEKADYIGSLETTLSEIVNAPSHVLERHLKNSKLSNPGIIRVVAEEVVDYKDILNFHLSGRDLKKPSFFSRCKFFYRISRFQDDGSYVLVHQSEVQHKSTNPGWSPASVPVVNICNGDYERPLLIEVMDWSRFGNHTLIGYCSTTISELSGNVGSELLLSNSNNKKGGIRGKIFVSACRIEKSDTFLDYLRAGAELSMTVAIDLSESNGKFADPTSLHFQSGTQYNYYQDAILSIGGILEPYDSDRKFPVYGFGAGLPGGANPPFFALNGNITQPEVIGARGIFNAYNNVVGNIVQTEPTLLAPLISSVCDKIEKGLAVPSVSGAQNYHILVIITDGQINDMEDTVKAVIRGSKLPLSIVIVGIGSNDFANMSILDADESILEANGVEAERDIVQFVPMNEFCDGDLTKLTSEVLREVPTQYLQYMKSRNIKPIPVIDHRRTSWRLY